MNCPNCGNTVSLKRSRCEMCGIDLTVFRRAYLRSNMYYNQGLEKAKIRDLSGAVTVLKKSLEMNKRNTRARNLLGLVYFEMGETVAALSEWVISKHFQTEENEADRYMEQIQSNPGKLDALNQAVKKYNLALGEAKNGNGDLAILQLKKVVSLNPHFIRAQQLLALLYMKNGDLERARKCLLKADKIDIANTSTLRYLKEIRQSSSQESGKPGTEHSQDMFGGSGAGIEPVNNYREDKPNIMAWVNLFIGMVVGIVFTFILIVPTARVNIREEYEKEKMDYNSDLMVQMAAVTSRDKEIASLQQKLEDKERELSNLKESGQGPQVYETLISAISLYQEFGENGIEKAEEDQVLELARLLTSVDISSASNENAVKIFTDLSLEVYPAAAVPAYEKGRQALEEEDLEQAKELLLLSYRCDADNDSTLYYLGRTYQSLDSLDEAAVYYNMLLEKFPDSELAGFAKTRLSEMGKE